MVWVESFYWGPDGHDLADFPVGEGLNYLIIKMLALFTSNWVLILNLFFLLGFPLITLTSLFVFRRLGIRDSLPFSASLLFAFLPYRLIKGEYHLFLTAYHLHPLVIWMALLLYQNKLKKPFFFIVSILLGSNGVYHAYFGSFFLLLGGIMGASFHRSWRPLRYATVCIALVTLSLAINVWPTFYNQWAHGKNHHFMKRDSIEAEETGLKIAQLLLPRDDDRLFSLLKKKYNDHALSVTENTTASLGLLGSLGFLGLILRLFSRRENGILDGLAHFNLATFLLATMGGFSSLISFFLLSGIRNYNRISVYIAFLSLAAFFLFFQKRFQSKTALWSPLLLAIGLYTQTSTMDDPKNRLPQIAEEFAYDKEFVHRIEQVLPPGSAVFQLPYIFFPELT